MNVNQVIKKRNLIFLVIGFGLFLPSCRILPQNADLDLNITLPEPKKTIYQATRKFGMMSLIYGTDAAYVMTKYVSDNTGASAATSYEIPRDVTEMVKSTLNAMGGNVVFVSFDPDFLGNSLNLGYSQFTDKIIPNVVISGGITEFDRGLLSRSDSAEIDLTIEDHGLNFEDQTQGSLAQVTMDFNLLDFQTLAGIPRVQAINSIKLHKAVREDSIGFTISSVTEVSIGAQGTIKKIQGRHAAVRLLVELSIVELIGKYLKIPYWRLLPNVAPDESVRDTILDNFSSWSNLDKTVVMQSYLHLYGYTVKLNGVLDEATESALLDFANKHGLNTVGIDEQSYLALFENIPLTREARNRRATMPELQIEEPPAQPEISQIGEEGEVLQLETDAEGVDTATVIVATAPSEPIDTAKVSVWTDKKDYTIGDNMIVNFSVDQDRYVRILLIDSAGNISNLFPNDNQSDSYCKAGITYQVPPTSSDFALTISLPRGKDKIRAVASTNVIKDEVLYFTQNGDFNGTEMRGFPVRAGTDISIY